MSKNIPIELRARALLELATTKTEDARVLMLRPVPDQDDGGKTDRVRTYLEALAKVEKIARRSVVGFDRLAAMEQLRELAEVGPEILEARALQLDTQFEAALVEAESALAREFWPRGRPRPAPPIRAAPPPPDRQETPAASPKPDTGWRGGHYGRLETPSMSESIGRLIDLCYDVIEDGPTYSAVWYGPEGEVRTISEGHETEGDAWEFLAAFALGQPPDQAPINRDDHQQASDQ